MKRTLLPMAALLALAACSGSKELTCAADQGICANACVSLLTDQNNCGACGKTCGAGQGCSAGACVDCAANPVACTAAVAVACFNTNEVRFLGQDLAQVGSSLPIAGGPYSIASLAGTFYVASDLASSLTPFTLAPLHPQAAIAVPAVKADLSHVTAHGGLLWASSSQMGTLVVVDPAAGQVVDEVPLAQTAGEYVNPQGIAFVGTKAYLALANAGAVAVLDVSAPRSTKVLTRIDVSKYATATATVTAEAAPWSLVASGGKVYVALSNIQTVDYHQVPGAHGKLVVIDPTKDAVVGDALDLGPDCLDAGSLALSGTTLWVGCGYYDFTSVQGSGLLPVAIGSGSPIPGPIVKTQSAIYALAVCEGRGYAGAAESGTVLAFDPTTGAVAGSGAACPAGQYGSFVPDLACTR